VIDLENAVISVDKDVDPAPPKRIRGLNMQSPIVLELQKLDLGDSWFVQDATLKDVRPYVDTGRKLGMYILARETDNDVIYAGQAGTRLWWRPESERPKRASKKGATPPVHDTDGRHVFETVRYWHHAESETVGICKVGERWPEDPLAEPIDEAEYKRLSDLYDDDL
jgi:hypothetical protein